MENKKLTVWIAYHNQDKKEIENIITTDSLLYNTESNNKILSILSYLYNSPLKHSQITFLFYDFQKSPEENYLRMKQADILLVLRMNTDLDCKYVYVGKGIHSTIQQFDKMNTPVFMVANVRPFFVKEVNTDTGEVVNYDWIFRYAKYTIRTPAKRSLKDIKNANLEFFKPLILN